MIFYIYRRLTMLLALDIHFQKLASQGKAVKPKRIPLPSRSQNCDDYFEGEIRFGNHEPKMTLRGWLCEGVRSPFGKVSPTQRKHSRLHIDKYFNDCLEKEAHSNLIRNRSFGKMLPDPKNRSRLRIDKYFDDHLEKKAQSKLNSKPIRNRSLTKPQEALMPRKKKEPEVIREYADATPRRSRVYVDELAHALKDYAKANNLPEVEAIAASLKWFMRFEDSFENFFVHGKADQHPEFKEFFSALLAQPHFKNLCGDEAASILKRKFPPKANPLMPNGYSHWASFNRKPYPLSQRALTA
jgi:hypothetical protein